MQEEGTVEILLILLTTLILVLREYGGTRGTTSSEFVRQEG